MNKRLLRTENLCTRQDWGYVSARRTLQQRFAISHSHISRRWPQSCSFVECVFAVWFSPVNPAVLSRVPTEGKVCLRSFVRFSSNFGVAVWLWRWLEWGCPPCIFDAPGCIEHSYGFCQGLWHWKQNVEIVPIACVWFRFETGPTRSQQVLQFLGKSCFIGYESLWAGLLCTNVSKVSHFSA